MDLWEQLTVLTENEIKAEELFHKAANEYARAQAGLIRAQLATRNLKDVMGEASRPSTDYLAAEFPESRPLYKDSGLWQMRSDDMDDVMVEQEVNEPFDAFIRRCVEYE